MELLHLPDKPAGGVGAAAGSDLVGPEGAL